MISDMTVILLVFHGCRSNNVPQTGERNHRQTSHCNSGDQKSKVQTSAGLVPFDAFSGLQMAVFLPCPDMVFTVAVSVS